MTLPDSIQKDRGQPSKVRIGTFTDGQFVLQDTILDPASVGVLGSYSPVPGDSVALLGQSAVGTSGTSWLALGRVLPTGTISLRGTRLTVTADSIGNFAVEAVNWQDSEWDTDGFWDAANPSVVTIPFTGVYAFTYNLVFQQTAGGGVRYIDLRTNGIRRVSHRHGAIVSDFNDLGLATELLCSTGDVITFTAFQTSGGALNTESGSATVRLVGILGS